MKFPEGSIIVDKQGERRKILGACGEVRFVDNRKAKGIPLTPIIATVEQIETSGYVEEAPRWEPKNGVTVFFVDFFAGEVSVCSSTWSGAEWQQKALAVGRVYQTEEAAEVAGERVCKALQNE